MRVVQMSDEQSIDGILLGSRVGVAGLGGMGSHVAVALARAGIGTLVIADFDRVDESNLHRQNYSRGHLGMPKAVATESVLRGIRPDMCIVPYDIRLDESNVADVFKGCDVVCEAFDDPVAKGMLVETLLSEDPDVVVVSCSGMAGYGSTSTMGVERRMSRLYVCGDGITDVSEGRLSAGRVMACAGMEAHATVRILLGSEP